MFLLLTLKRFYTFFWCFHYWLWTSKSQLEMLLPTSSGVSFDEFEQVIVCWVNCSRFFCHLRPDLYPWILRLSQCKTLSLAFDGKHKRKYLYILVSIADDLLTKPLSETIYPTNNYLFNVNNRNTTKMFKICSKLTIKTLERRQWRRCGVFIVNFKHISHLFLVFLMLTLSK